MAFVPEPRRVRSLWLGLLGVLGLMILCSAYLPMEGRVSGYCLLEPARAWSLVERQVGSYESRTEDRIAGRILSCRIHQFSREAVLELGLRATDLAATRVEAGDIVAELRSSNLDLELAERSTALAEARSRLANLRAGAKPAALKHARLRQERAASELAAQAAHYARSQGLFAEGGISVQEWEEIQAQRELLQLDLSLADTELEVLESGDRPTEIAGAEEALSSLERELQALESVHAGMAIRSPFAGELRMNPETGVLLRVAALDTLVASILLPQRRADELAPGQAVHALIPGLGNEVFHGTLLRVEQDVIPTERGPYIRAVGLLPRAGGRLEAGMQGRARISVGRSTLLTRAKRGLQAALFRELGP